MTELAVVRGEVVHSLAENEEVIERGQRTFVEVGSALAEIREERQYIEAGFDTFEDYCKQRWGLSYSYAYNQIAAAKVVNLLRTLEISKVPENHEQARSLTKLLNERGEQAVASAWQQIVEHHGGEGPITGREVSRFLAAGGSYGKPGWHELLGEVGDTLLRAQKQMEKFDAAIGERPRAEAIREKAARYAEWAEDLAERLRKVAA